jgi:hypothetical protein
MHKSFLQRPYMLQQKSKHDQLTALSENIWHLRRTTIVSTLVILSLFTQVIFSLDVFYSYMFRQATVVIMWKAYLVAAKCFEESVSIRGYVGFKQFIKWLLSDKFSADVVI